MKGKMKNMRWFTPIVLLALLIMSIATGCASSAYPSSPGTYTSTPIVPHSPSYGTPSMPTSMPSSPSYNGGPSQSGQYPSYPSSGGNIGLSAGGAKDVNNFRDNIKNAFLPLPTDITYEGLFYDYYFDTGQQKPSNKLFSPSYSYAVTKDPFSQKTEYYLSVGLNSGLKQSDFNRKLLNLVIVLDMSGSMSSPFDEYYYDSTGVQVRLTSQERNQQKLEVAKDAIMAITDQLGEGDRLGIVVFDTTASVLEPITAVSHLDMNDVQRTVNKIQPGGSTDLSSGMKLGTELLNKYSGSDPNTYENRIIFITDAMPNTGETGEYSLARLLKKNADSHMYTTFIGVGVDFNTELVDYITKTRGANYYSVHSPTEFMDRVDNEFDYMVTPLVFNLKLNLEAKGWDIQRVYGSPEADQATGEIMQVNTLFPSENKGGETRGGLILLKLTRHPGETGSLKLTASYEDRSGRKDSSESTISLESTGPEYFDNSGIQKGVLLARYADLMKDWISDQRENAHVSVVWKPRVNMDEGICIPPVPLSTWERQSMPLNVSSEYRTLFKQFSGYFVNEMDQIGDEDLGQELSILQALSKYR
jgi:Ca-activated chloride channel homolog